MVSGKMIDKVMDFLGLDDDSDDIEEMNEIEQNNSNKNQINSIINDSRRNASNKVVSIHTASTSKVVILKPSHYDEAVEICDSLKNRKIIVVNMTNLDAKIAQRLLDFIAGSCYALEGSLEEIEKGVYILSPSNIEVSSELKSELSGKGLFNFAR